MSDLFGTQRQLGLLGSIVAAFIGAAIAIVIARSVSGRRALNWPRNWRHLMADRSDEIKGGLKEGLGKLTLNPDLEVHGRNQKSVGRARRTVSAVLKEARGKVKRTIGKLIGSRTLEVEGEAEQLRGRADRL